MLTVDLWLDKTFHLNLDRWLKVRHFHIYIEKEMLKVGFILLDIESRGLNFDKLYGC